MLLYFTDSPLVAFAVKHIKQDYFTKRAQSAPHYHFFGRKQPGIFIL